MSGPGAATVAQVEAYWQQFLQRAGKKPVVRDATLGAYVNHGRWVADCLYCAGGVACWSENPRGCCLDCGSVYKIRFPKDTARAVEVLEQRPEINRNWRPDAGETLGFLALENAENNLPVPASVLAAAEKAGLAAVLEARA